MTWILNPPKKYSTRFERTKLIWLKLTNEKYKLIGYKSWRSRKRVEPMPFRGSISRAVQLDNQSFNIQSFRFKLVELVSSSVVSTFVPLKIQRIQISRPQ